MSLNGQRVDPGRYSLVRRTLSFIIRKDDILLLKLGDNRGGWNGLYNGIGGHVERGEDPLSAAGRELREETGLESRDQRLCGVISIDTGAEPGIELFIFVGHTGGDTLSSSEEGQAVWVPRDRLSEYNLLEDLPVIIPRALEAYARNDVFFASYSYSSTGRLEISLIE